MNLPFIPASWRQNDCGQTTYNRLNENARLIASYRLATIINPHDAHAHACLGICYLRLGDFHRGWQEYEWRLKVPDCPESLPSMAPRWRGQSLKGKTIFIKAGQGFGDVIQFIRYAPQIKEMGGTVIVECYAKLGRLLSECCEIDHVVTKWQMIPHSAFPLDFEAMLLSMPYIFRTSLVTIPASVPYLNIPAAAGLKAMAMIARRTGELRVGISWAGGVLHKNDHRRSLRLEQLSGLLAVPGVNFFSLQKGQAVVQISAYPNITNLDPYLDDFADTAAAIQELDLVISVDTSVAHLAGALGKPVWTLLPFVSDWRWMLEREDSPWYPTMRLFRQSVPGDWDTVIQRVREELQRLVQKKVT